MKIEIHGNALSFEAENCAEKLQIDKIKQDAELAGVHVYTWLEWDTDNSGIGFYLTKKEESVK